MQSLEAFLGQVARAAHAEEGRTLAGLLDPLDPHAFAIQGGVSAVQAYLDGYVGARLEGPWADVAVPHLRVILALQAESLDSAAAEQNNAVVAFQKIFQRLGRWALPVLYSLNMRLRQFSGKADAELVESGQKPTRLEAAARTINKSFSQCITDRGTTLAESRKWGVYYIIGLLFPIYFRLNTQNLCKNLLRALAQADLPDLSVFPMAHQVTFRYWTGMLHFLNEDYPRAEEDLDFALRHCWKGAEKNKVLILHHLIPIRLLRGSLPAPALLARHPSLAPQFAPFVAALQAGSLALFDGTLEARAHGLLAAGTYLTMEKARWVALRRGLRNLAGALRPPGAAPDPAAASRLRLADIAIALAVPGGPGSAAPPGPPMALEEVECLVANLIDKGYIKGYLSHEKGYLVMSKADPFPVLQNVS